MEKHNISSALLTSKKTFRNFIPIRILIFITLQTLLTYNLFSQPVTQEWVRRYDSPEHLSEGGNLVRTDYAGNIYVVGNGATTSQQLDIIFLKYNSAGVQQWVRFYNGPSNGNDFPYDMYVDSVGNIYVTGYSESATFVNDIITIKYNSAGVLQWAARYDDPVQASESAYSIAVDNTGNSYITGSGYAIGGGNDVITIKYNSNGDSLWVKRFHESGTYGNYNDGGKRVKLDQYGNVIVLAVSNSNYPPIEDYLVIKYNNNGNQLWFSKYSRIGQDLPFDMAIDPLNNIITTGITNIGQQEAYGTVKFNSNGNQVWVRTYYASGTAGHEARAIVVDENSCVYVTGSSYGGGSNSRDIATVKYDSSGTQQWVQRYNGPGTNSYDEPAAMIIDDSSNIYITGGDQVDFITIKYDSYGNQRWIERYQGGGNSIVLDRNWNAFVTGSNSQAGTGFDIISIKYSQLVGIKQISRETLSGYRLFQNYPNPFNSETLIAFYIPVNRKGENSRTALKIYDILGRKIDEIVNQNLSSGEYEFKWNAEKFNSGVYFYKIISGDFTETKKMILIK